MPIVTELKYGVLRLRIHRPERRNTLTAEMFGTLAETLRSAASDPKVRVAVLCASNGLFSAGADLEESLRTPEKIDREADAFFEALSGFPKPVLADVRGPAVGDAFALLLHCDLVYVTPRSLFSLPSVALARTPRFGAAALLEAAAGYPRAAEKLLLSEPVSADEALSMRLVTGIVEEEKIDETVAAKAARLAVLPPGALEATKRLLKSARSRLLDALREEEITLYAERCASPEAREALQAFLESRKPVFRPED